MRAYYNEIDSYAARWLRNLIAAGHITPGEVDERSILDVRPDDLVGFDRCHFFAGIGVWDHALNLAGWPEGRPVWTGSCPCQPFSAAGKRGGTADERHLWPAFFHLIEQRGPATVLGEQVASKDGLDWLDLVQADLEGAGYDVGSADLCAAGVGAPHIRQRLWFVADYDGDRSQGGQPAQSSGRGRRSADSRRETCAVADAGCERLDRESSRLWQSGATGRDAAHRSEAARSRETGIMADASGERRHGGEFGRASGATQARGPEASGGRTTGICQPPGCGSTGSVAVTAESGSQGSFAAGQRPDAQFSPVERGGASRGIGHNDGPSLTFWSECDWIPCRDGKARPVEPGTFPLAHGAPARVGRLRAYGNAIVAEAAIAFIEAVMQARP